MLYVVKIIKTLLNRLQIFPKFRIDANNLYHHLILKKLWPYFCKALFIAKHQRSLNNSRGNSHIIWIFWWQGQYKMPSIVRCCINSIKKNSPKDTRIILITKFNIIKLTTLPHFIFSKVKLHQISLTHLSDILRFNLLYNYGGLWVDATVYCTSLIDNNVFGHIYTCGGYNNKYHQFISSKWTGFLIGGTQHELLFNYMNSFFKLYWEHNHKLLDYFLIDYALYFAYVNNLSGFKDYSNKTACKNNPCLYYLCPILNHKFNKLIYDKITLHTNLFKLTYKKNFNYKIDSFYNRLIHNKL